MSETLLSTSLEVAVPLWIEKLRGQPWVTLHTRAQACGAIIAHQGDRILFTSKRPGETAAAFNALAEAIAVLSFLSGGVTIFGGHWETTHE